MKHKTGEMEVMDRIRARAYQIFEERGGEFGRDHEDWLRAEEEVYEELLRGTGPVEEEEEQVEVGPAAVLVGR
jgi:hypothetical protein